MTNAEAEEAVENPNTVPWHSAPHPITGRWRIVTPLWEMTPIGSTITAEKSRAICERVVAAVWRTEETAEEALWRARAAYNAEQIKRLEAEVATLKAERDAAVATSDAACRSGAAWARAATERDEAMKALGVMAEAVEGVGGRLNIVGPFLGIWRSYGAIIEKALVERHSPRYTRGDAVAGITKRRAGHAAEKAKHAGWEAA